MKEFWRLMTTEWWGILIICLVCFVLWTVMSVMLYRCFFKRFYDVVLSAIAIIVFSVLLLVLTVIGAIEMRGNPFFVQARPGKRKKLTKKQCDKINAPYGTYGKERIIKLIKFRTMSNKKDKNGKLLPDEERLNGYGRMLRATSLDELPSLVNIFKGDISIVGPRPQLVKDMIFMTEEVRARHNVRPGLTGLAQVSGRNNISWDKKFEYDLQYIGNITLINDIKIILKTVIKVFKRSDINREGTATDLDYGDWLLQNGMITQAEYDAKLKDLY